MMRDIWKTKTFWTGLGAVAFGVVLIAQGQTAEGIQTVIGGVGMIFLRAGINRDREQTK